MIVSRTFEVYDRASVEKAEKKSSVLEASVRFAKCDVLVIRTPE